jgi:hypothetical protein
MELRRGGMDDGSCEIKSGRTTVRPDGWVSYFFFALRLDLAATFFTGFALILATGFLTGLGFALATGLRAVFLFDAVFLADVEADERVCLAKSARMISS